jgi:hypothetical protein
MRVRAALATTRERAFSTAPTAPTTSTLYVVDASFLPSSGNQSEPHDRRKRCASARSWMGGCRRQAVQSCYSKQLRIVGPLARSRPCRAIVSLVEVWEADHGDGIDDAHLN